MSSKNWIMVKRGLSEDPKHRQDMGNRIWLFLHIIDRCNWETGVAHDWRDKDEADDMGMQHRTLTQQRQELAELGYITCVQRKHGQDIVIHNWINPRNYSGGVLNPKGTEITVPLKSKGTVKGTVYGSRKFRTPTSDSGNQVSGDQHGADEPRPRDELFDAIALACSVDPATAGSSIGKVKSALLKAKPPYTADEVRAWCATWPAWKDKPPTLWQLKEQIGAIRIKSSGNGKNGGGGSSLFRVLQEMDNGDD